MPSYLSPSASAISLYLQCPARFAGRYVEGVKEPFGPAAQKGVRGHKLAQRYMQIGELPSRADPLDKAVRQMIKVLPVKAASVAERNIERAILLVDRGIEYTGYMDWEHDLLHGDLKFTGNDARFRKQDPYADVQRLIYASDWFERHHGERTSDSWWTVSRFDGAGARAYKKTLDRKKVKKAFDKVVAPAVYQLLGITSKQADWQDQPKNPSACNLYPPHGCPMRAHGCKVDPVARLHAIRPKPTLLKTLLKGTKNG